MKIIDLKGNLKNISSHFHSKEEENQFKKYYIALIISLGVLFFILSVFIFMLISDIIISILAIIILAILFVLLKNKYSFNFVMWVMKKKDSIEEQKKIKKNYKYSQLEFNSTKKSKFKRFVENTSYKIKSKVNSKKGEEDKYIEIK